jgi:hypothetical protein
LRMPGQNHIVPDCLEQNTVVGGLRREKVRRKPARRLGVSDQQARPAFCRSPSRGAAAAPARPSARRAWRLRALRSGQPPARPAPASSLQPKHRPQPSAAPRTTTHIVSHRPSPLQSCRIVHPVSGRRKQPRERRV